MASISESRTTSASLAQHLSDHNELHRKTNRLVVEASTVTDNIMVSDPDVDNAIASDTNSGTLIGGGQSGRENIIGGDGSSTVNTATPNTTTTSTGANLCTIIGGYDNVAGGLASFIGGNHNYTAVGTSHGTIGGGSVQKITGTADFGTITGGTLNEVSETYGTITGGARNTVSGNAGTVGGGKDNTVSAEGATVAGGNTNTATDLHATVGGGYLNDATADYSTIIGGYNNTASGNSSTVVGGYQNTASGELSAAMGLNAAATQSCALTIGGGQIAALGDAQSTTIVARNQSTSASGVKLRPRGNIRIVVPSDTTWAFRALIVARRTDADGESAAYDVVGCCDNNAGTLALVGSVSKTVVAEDTAAWDITVSVDDANDELVFTATGEASKTINWVMRLDVSEVTG